MGRKCSKCHTVNSSDSQFCKKCAAPLPSQKKISISHTKTVPKPKRKPAKRSVSIGRYQIIEELGRGGMGVVYKAEDTKLKRTVALKFLPPDLMKDPEAKERFIREAQAAAALDHPNICTVYEVDEEKDQAFISMAFVEGQSLKDRIKSGTLDIEEAVDIAVQVAEGLKEAHEKGIVHRDIKPANIMLTKKGQAKITDFGLAKISWGVDLTKTSTIMGTAAYMSPEQARGEEVDHKTDIWSLGAMLYEMLTGKRPFQKSHEQALIYSILNEEPKPLSTLRSGIPKYLEQVIEKTLKKDLDLRYQNVQEFAHELKKKLPVTVAKAEKSIAVLPFVNMSADPEQEYFCDGMAEELINALTQIKDLRVVARTSAFSFKGKDVDTEEIGKKLKVNHILEGSVRKADNRLRITAQLINVEDGYHLWSERYDRKIEDIFAIQDEVTLAIVDKLRIELLKEEKERLLKRYTENSEVHNIYLRGRYFWNKRTGDGLKKAIEFFQETIENDPLYAPAYSGLADCFSVLAFYGFSPPREAFPKAKAAAQKALEIDDALSEAHASLAYISIFYDWDWDTAERSLKRAIELNPGYAHAHHVYAAYLAIMGRFDEAVAKMKRSVEVDPLSVRIHTELGNYLCWAGRLDEATVQFQKTLEMDQNFGLAHGHFGLCHTRKKRYEEAISATLKAVELLGKLPFFLGYLGNIYSRAGKKDKAKEILQELEETYKKRYVPPSSIANIYAELGEFDKAFEWMEKAYEEHDIFLAMFKTRAEFEKLRSDPRADILLKKIGLSD